MKKFNTIIITIIATLIVVAILSALINTKSNSQSMYELNQSGSTMIVDNTMIYTDADGYNTMIYKDADGYYTQIEKDNLTQMMNHYNVQVK